MPRKLAGPLLALWIPVVILCVWELLAARSIIDPLFFPPPTKLFATVVEMLGTGELGDHIRTTLVRATAGFAIGALAGIAVGTLMGVFPFVRRSLEPSLSALYAVPKLTMLPILMLITGIGETPRLVLIAATVFLLVVMHTLDGVRGVSPHYVEMAVNQGASRWLLFRRVYLPASAPQIFTGLRLAMGRALVITISAELITGGGGLGGLVWRSWQTFATERLYIAIITSALLGAAIHKSLKLAEARLIPWRDK